MIIRRAIPEDIPQIVSLLKKSLGETRIPKSEKLWNWKHNENAFGKSEVNLAFEGDRLVGVRPFMKWNWKMNNNVYHSLRAVDTAILPEFQGMGIFTSLTKDLVSQLENDFDFIFNTPNNKSRKGYYKLGWSSQGRMPVNIVVRLWKPFEKLFQGKSNNLEEYRLSKLLPEKVMGVLEKVLESESKVIVSDKTAEFIQWRYVRCPVFDYYALGEENGRNSYLLIFRLRKKFKLTELRVVDSFFHRDFAGSDDLDEKLVSFLQVSGANLITFPMVIGNLKRLSNFFNRSVRINIGPAVTIKKLNSSINQLSLGQNWFPTFGDLELF